VSVSGEATPDGPTMANVLQKYEPDTRVKLKIVRKGRPRTISLALCDVAAQAGLHE